jgi:hypothetical protein
MRRTPIPGPRHPKITLRSASRPGEFASTRVSYRDAEEICLSKAGFEELNAAGDGRCPAPGRNRNQLASAIPAHDRKVHDVDATGTARTIRQSEKTAPAGQQLREVGELWTREAKAPTYEELRPFGHRETSGFPVYKNLEERLLRARAHPDPEIAHVMATCSAYAYSGPETVSMIMARLGLEDNQCRMIQLSVDALLLRSTAFVIQSKSGRVAILCYRGTEPLNLINWMVNLDLEPERISYQIGDRHPMVHGGFYRNTRATRYEVMNTLRRACERRSVRVSLSDGAHGADLSVMEGNLEALYITGHSLGGAMAGLMAVMIRHERKYREVFADRLKAVYTFGQPMIGNPDFAEACQSDEFLREKVIRYVYDNDIVPHLPPAVSGPFQHFGREYQYRIPHLRNTMMGLLEYLGCAYRHPEGKWEKNVHLTSQAAGVPAILLANLAFVVGKFQLTRSLPAVYSVEDHFPRHYISSLIPCGVQNEFGD